MFSTVDDVCPPVDPAALLVFEEIAARWRATNEWPRRSRLRLHFRPEGLALDEILAKASGDLWKTLNSGGDVEQQRIRLTLAGLELTSGGLSEVSPALQLVRPCLNRYLANGASARVVPADLLGFVPQELGAAMARLEHLYILECDGMSGVPGAWELVPDLAFLRYEGVSSAWDYLRRRCSYFRRRLPALEPVHRELLDRIYRHRLAAEEWPRIDPFAIANHDIPDVLHRLQEISQRYLARFYLQTQSGFDRLKLRLEAVSLIANEGEPEAALRVLQVLRLHYEATAGEVLLSAAEVATRAGVTDAFLMRLRDLLEREADTGLEFDAGPEAWNARAGILSWDGVSTFAEYLGKRAQLREMRSKELGFPLDDDGNPTMDSSEEEVATDSLDSRSFHPAILAAARSHFRNGMYRSCVLDASTALTMRVKEITGRHDLDGRKLMAEVLSDTGILRVNELGTSFDRGEQEGWRMMFMGAMQALRNPSAHGLHEIEPGDALDFLSFLSLLMRKLESMTVVEPPQS